VDIWIVVSVTVWWVGGCINVWLDGRMDECWLSFFGLLIRMFIRH